MAELLGVGTFFGLPLPTFLAMNPFCLTLFTRRKTVEGGYGLSWNSRNIFVALHPSFTLTSIINTYHSYWQPWLRYRISLTAHTKVLSFETMHSVSRSRFREGSILSARIDKIMTNCFQLYLLNLIPFIESLMLSA